MQPIVCALVLNGLALVTFSAGSSVKRHTALEDFRYDDFRGHTDKLERRYKRAMPTILGALFKGAVKLVDHGDYRLYSKAGGYGRARNDFEALGLPNVKKTKSLREGLIGEIGGRSVNLSRGKNGGGFIDIWLYKLHNGRLMPEKVDRIRYMDKN